MEVIVADQIIMGLILHAGDAKQHIYQALSLAKNGEFEFFTGGGITCESEIKKEYDELYEKAYFTF